MHNSQLLPFQQRVVVEKNELEQKISALGSYLTSPYASGLPPEERKRMSTQFSIMNAYVQILEARIAAFESP